MGGVTIKGASQYLAYRPREKKQDRSKNVNEESYFKNIISKRPHLEKYDDMIHNTGKLFNDFKQTYKNNGSAFLND
jgi:hypothetical protein